MWKLIRRNVKVNKTVKRDFYSGVCGLKEREVANEKLLVFEILIAMPVARGRRRDD